MRGAACALIGILVLWTCQATADDKPRLTAAEVESKAIALLSAGQQEKAEELLGHWVASDQSSQRVNFLVACCARSRFMVAESAPIFAAVVRMGIDTPEGECSLRILDLDRRKNVDQQFTALRNLVELHPDDPMLRWMIAVQCRSLDKNAEGVEHYKKLLEKWNPGPALVHQTYGNLLHELHRFDEALAERRKTVELEPRASWAHQGLGNTLSCMRRYDEASAAFAKATEIAPDHGLYWANWASNLCQQGKPEEAVVKCQRAAELDPTDITIICTWGDCLEKLDKFDEALAKYRQAIKLAPQDQVAKLRLRSLEQRICPPRPAHLREADAKLSSGEAEARVIALLKDGKQTEAEALLKAQTKPTQRLMFLDACCLRSRAAIQEAVNRFHAAEKAGPDTTVGQCCHCMVRLDQRDNLEPYFDALRKLADQHPDEIAFRWMLATQYRNHHRVEEALAQYRMLSAAWKPGPATLHQACGDLLEETRRFDEALVERRVAVEQEPAGWSYQGLGNTLMRLRQWKEASEAYAKSVDADPKRGSYWRNWATAQCACGDIDAAIAKCKIAIELDPDEFISWYLWGTYLERQGKTDEALAKFQHVLTLRPNDPNTLRRIESLKHRGDRPPPPNGPPPQRAGSRPPQRD